MVLAIAAAGAATAQGQAAPQTPDSVANSENEAAAQSPTPVYPRGVSPEGDALFVVDSDLPGVWKATDPGVQPELYVRGSTSLRQPLSRPFCAIAVPGGDGILVGDAATREVYRVSEPGGKPEPLSGGQIGIPMALAVDPQAEMLYVGDAETCSVLRLPLGGGDPERVVRVNARGLVFDNQGRLYAVTPEADAVQRIDVKAKTAETIVDGRPYAYPNGIAWAGAHGYVTDGYGNTVWRFTADGQTGPWYEGDPLVGPVGIAATEQSVFVADPKSKQVYEIDRESKEITERL